jgi:hypothetical protein
MLYFFDLLGKVIEAAELLTDEPGNREKGAVITPSSESDLLNPYFYCSQTQKEFPAWQCFPRHLSRSEYLDPYWVLEKCFQRKSSAEWRAFLMDLFCAASKNDNSIVDDTHDIDIYRTCRYLFKLLEACHLIKVREMGNA